MAQRARACQGTRARHRGIWPGARGGLLGRDLGKVQALGVDTSSPASSPLPARARLRRERPWLVLRDGWACQPVTDRLPAKQRSCGRV